MKLEQILSILNFLLIGNILQKNTYGNTAKFQKIKYDKQNARIVWHHTRKWK